MELLQPLAIEHVALAARQIFDMAGIDQDHFKPARLQDLVRCYPVTAGAFQGDGGDGALFEPAGHLVQRGRVTAESAHRFHAPARRDRDIMLARADVDGRGIEVDRFQAGRQEP